MLGLDVAGYYEYFQTWISVFDYWTSGSQYFHWEAHMNQRIRLLNHQISVFSLRGKSASNPQRLRRMLLQTDSACVTKTSSSGTGLLNTITTIYRQKTRPNQTPKIKTTFFPLTKAPTKLTQVSFSATRNHGSGSRYFRIVVITQTGIVDLGHSANCDRASCIRIVQRNDIHIHEHIYIYICVCVYMYMCIYVNNIYIYIYIYMLNTYLRARS